MPDAVTTYSCHAGSRVRGLWTYALLDALWAVGIAAALATALSSLNHARDVLVPSAMLLVFASLRAACARRAHAHAVSLASAWQSAQRRRVLEALLAPPRSAGAIGERAALAVEDIEALEGYAIRYVPAQIAARLAPGIIALAVFFASPVAAVILLGTLLPFALIAMLAGDAAARSSRRQLDALARLTGLFADRIRALPIVLAYDAAPAQTRHVGVAASEVAERTLGVLRVAFVTSAALDLFSALAIALVAVYAGFSLLGLLPFPAPEVLEFREAFFALALAPEFYATLRRLAAAYHERQLGEAALDRMSGLAGAGAGVPAVDAIPRGERASHAAPPSIELQEALVRHGDDEASVGPVSFSCPAGKLTVLLGPSGTGKTSLLRAMLGVTPLASGRLEVGGAPSPGLGRRAAWCGQAPYFLPGTLSRNLGSDDEDATRELLHALGLDALLAKRPEGLELVVDEQGSGLSGGEQRRLGLARALLANRDVLLLDEPTAELDAATEARVMQALVARCGSRTIVVATHSPRLAAIADHVVSLA